MNNKFSKYNKIINYIPTLDDIRVECSEYQTIKERMSFVSDLIDIYEELNLELNGYAIAVEEQIETVLNENKKEGSINLSTFQCSQLDSKFFEKEKNSLVFKIIDDLEDTRKKITAECLIEITDKLIDYIAEMILSLEGFYIKIQILANKSKKNFKSYKPKQPRVNYGLIKKLAKEFHEDFLKDSQNISYDDYNYLLRVNLKSFAEQNNISYKNIRTTLNRYYNVKEINIHNNPVETKEYSMPKYRGKSY